jgi:hypothetical protein
MLRTMRVMELVAFENPLLGLGFGDELFFKAVQKFRFLTQIIFFVAELILHVKSLLLNSYSLLLNLKWKFSFPLSLK